MEFREKRTTHGGVNYWGKLTYAELKNKARELKGAAYSDERTGLLNPRGLFEEFERSKAIFERDNSFGKYSIIALDLIGLHSLNKMLGRIGADEVITNAAKSLITSTRETDLKCRYDGDEFMLIAFNCPSDEAARIIDLINSNLPKNVKYTIGYKDFLPDSDFKYNVNKMKEGVEKIKESRPRDSDGRVVGNGLVVKID